MVLYFKSFSIISDHKKINIHALLPMLPKGFLNEGEDKVSFSAGYNNENILRVGHETKHEEEASLCPFALFQTWLSCSQESLKSQDFRCTFIPTLEDIQVYGYCRKYLKSNIKKIKQQHCTSLEK